MRILFVTNMCTHYTKPLFEMLGERATVDFVFFSGGEEWYLSNEMKHAPGDFNTISMKRKTVRGQVFLPDLPRLLADGGYDAVVKCLNGRLMVPFTYFGARRSNTPIVLWTGLWDHPGTPVHRLTRPLLGSLYRHADACVAYGSHVERHLVGAFSVNPASVFVAGQAVDGARFANDRAVDTTEPVALYVGQLETRKGIKDLIGAFRSLPDEDFVLRVVGSGSLEGWVKDQAAADGRIDFLGYRTQEQLRDEYAAARCLVLPSVRTTAGREPWGLVVNEAMHAGRPVVATDAVGAAAAGLVVDGSNGRVVAEGDVAGLAAALSAILGDLPTAERMAAQAEEDVRRFSYPAMVDAFEEAAVYASG